MPKRLPVKLFQYGLALFAAAAVLVLGAALQSALGPAAPMALFAVGVLVSARVGGFGPGLVATLGTAAGAAYFFIAPIDAIWISSLGDRIWLALFVGFGTTFSWLMGEMRGTSERIRQASASLELRRRAMEAATCGFAIADLRKPRAPILYVNAAFQHITGYRRDEIIGQSLSILDGASSDPAATTTLEAAIADAKEWRLAFESFRKDRSRFWVDLVVTPVRAASGEPTHVVAVLNDITRAKCTEQALRESEERLRLACEGAAIGIWSYDTATELVECTPLCRCLLGLSAVGPVSFDAFLGAVEPTARAAFRAAIDASLLNQQSFRVECRGSTSIGRASWLAFPARALRGAGHTPRVTGAVFDVTSRRLAHDALEEQQAHQAKLLESERIARTEAERASRMKDEFVATLSHEVRTPLNAILGWVQILRSGQPSVERTARGLDVVERNARLLVKIIEDLLDVSRAVAGTLQIDLQRVDLRPIVEAALASSQLVAEAKGVTLALDLEAHHPIVFGDARRLQQVTSNLVSNAVKFTPRGGRVDLSLTVTDGHVVLSVRDTGQGLPTAFLPYAFDRFRQADSSSARAHGGLGLGLWLVKHFVGLHAGTVSAESSGPGEGATFTVRLPAATREIDSESLPALARTAEKSAHMRLAGIRVLVVEDEADAREVLERVLTDSGAEVLVVSSATEALRLLECVHVDVALCDIGMPEHDGHWLIRELRKRPIESGGRTPAAAVTAFARLEDREQALEAGYDAHVTKPIFASEVVNVVWQLSTHRAL